MEELRRRVLNEATLLFLDYPAGNRVGLDLKSYVCGDKFQGFKLVPVNGIHLVYYATGDDNEVNMMGYFVKTVPGMVQVQRFESSSESFVRMPEGAELENYKAGVRRFDFDSGLGAYEENAQWGEVSSFVSEEVLLRCGVPLGQTIVPGDLYDSKHEHKSPVVPFFEGAPRAANFTLMMELLG